MLTLHYFTNLQKCGVCVTQVWMWNLWINTTSYIIQIIKIKIIYRMKFTVLKKKKKHFSNKKNRHYER